LKCDFFEIKPTAGRGTGESFIQFPVMAEDFIMADRGYSCPDGIAYVANAGAYVMVRVNTGSLPFFAPSGKRFSLLNKLKNINQPGQIGEWGVVIQATTMNVAGRLCVVRKSEQAITEALRKLKRQETKHGTQTRAETMEYAKYVIVFTSFPQTYPAEQILEWYRLRWQIGVSSQGHFIQSVRDRPRLKDSSLVAWEAPWRESKTVEPSDNILRKECAQRTRLQRAVNADVASLHAIRWLRRSIYVESSKGVPKGVRYGSPHRRGISGDMV
jgi:hypothetical protein